MRQTILRLTIVILSSMMVATSFVACGDDEEKTPIVEPVQNDTQVEAQAIDLGLPSGTKWANMNVGATAPWDNGLYFAWGETTGYLGDASDGHSFEWSSYKLWTVGSGTLKKYNSNNDFGIVDNKTTLEAGDDAARVNWGGEWRMPTQDDVKELLEHTTIEFDIVNGKSCYIFHSKINGNSVLFPQTGMRIGKAPINVDTGYWTSSLCEYNSQKAYMFYFGNFMSSDLFSVQHDRSNGLPVRPVYGGSSSSGSGSGNNGGGSGSGDNGGGSGSGDNGGSSGSGNSGSDTSPVWGKVTGTISAIGPGVTYSSEASFADGKSTTVDYVYYPSTGNYYVYGGTFCSQPEVNGGKGLRYDAKKGYNSITIKYGFYYDYSTKIRYDWELRLRVTLP